MTIKARISFLLLLSLCAFTPDSATAAASADRWVGTWAASPMAAKNPDGKFGAPGTNGTTLREEAVKLAPPLKDGSGVLTAEKFDQIVRPEKMTGPGAD